MKSIIILLMTFGLMLGSCKENAKVTKSKTEVPEQKSTIKKTVSPIFEKMAKFANLTFVDSVAVNQLFTFKEIDDDGILKTVDTERVIILYKGLMKREKATSWPIFEIKGNDTAILPIVGKGFGGAIWGKVLVDRKTLEIKKIEFEHKAESEGYGAAMTQSFFEGKFVGTIINLEKSTFALHKNNIEKRIDDGIIIDGISGATMTSKSVVEMVNYGLQRYRGYLDSL